MNNIQGNQEKEKTNQGEQGKQAKVSPASVERYLKGIKYPADKQGVLDQAKENNAPSDVMSILSRFSDQEYNSSVDVIKEISNNSND